MLVVSALGLSSLAAQELSPEQPDWADNALPAAESPVQESAAPADSQSALADDAADLPSAPADGTDSIGVPNRTNFFLPDFGDIYGQPFFEWEGLNIRLGPVHAELELALSAEYTDNLFGANTNPVPDIVTSFKPSFLIGIGDYRNEDEDFVSLRYQPSLDNYVDHANLNRTNQFLTIQGHVTLSRLTSELNLVYQNLNTLSAVDTGRQTYEILTAIWENAYFLTDKTFLRLDINTTYQWYESGQAYQTYSVSPQIGYVLTGKTTLLMGPMAGISYIGSTAEEGSTGDQTFQGINVGAIYQYSPKLSAQGNLGIQSRQYHGENFAGASNFTTPVYSLSIAYDASDQTEARLNLLRNVQLSDIAEGQTYTNSQAELVLHHSLTDRLSLDLSLIYQYIEYQGSSSNDHIDKYLSFNPRINYTFFHNHLRLTVYYRRQNRDSTLGSSDYTTNTYGVELSCDF